MDDRLMVGARRPAGVRGHLLPGLAVGRRPDIVFEALFVAEVVIFGAAEDPHFVLERNSARGDARRPAGVFCDWSHWAPSVEDQTSLLAECL